MTKHELQEILKQANEIMERCKKIDKALSALLNLICPEQYPPSFDNDEFSGFVNGLRSANPDLGKAIAWYFWEITIDGETAYECTLSSAQTNSEERTFHVKDDATFLEYLEALLAG